MSSRKHRKHIRKMACLYLYRDQAARLFFNKESIDRYNKELSEINSDMSAQEIWIRTQNANSNYFGSGYMDWVAWAFGSIKLSFAIPGRKGKIRVNDLIVKRIKEARE